MSTNRHRYTSMTSLKKDTKRLLLKHYGLPSDFIAERREFELWENDNLCGFFLGVVEYGDDCDADIFHKLLTRNEFSEKEQELKQRKFAEYIELYKKHRSDRCVTSQSSVPSSSASSAKGTDCLSKSNRKKRKMNGSIESIFSLRRGHNKFKKAVEKRDKRCVFCWAPMALQAAHIVAHKNGLFITIDQKSVMHRTGLTNLHQAQNGILLCANCHGLFDKLLIYVDKLEGGQLVVNYVRPRNENSELFEEWMDAVGDLKIIRTAREMKFSDGRKAVDSEGNFPIYFTGVEESDLPNLKALEWHKRACLIWNMAGGAESEEEECSCDEDEELREYVPFYEKDIAGWINSSTNINPESAEENFAD